MTKERDKSLITPETLVEIQRFSQEQREALEKEGYATYELTGQSIKSLREQGNPFWSSWHEGYPKLEALISRRSEVAINPKQLFIPGSNHRTFLEQQAMVKRFSKDISTRIPGVEAVLGEIPDYAELVFLSPAEQRLFGEKYNYNYTRTKTRIVSDVADVGDFRPVRGLRVCRWLPDIRDVNLFAAPLVVPISGTK